MTTCVGSSDGGAITSQVLRGGSSPTPTLFNKRDWWVDEVSLHKARGIVEKWHYAKSGANTATFRHGLFPRDRVQDDECVGVAWWIPPTKTAAQFLAGDRWRGVLSLSRLAIDDSVPKNAESFLLRHSMRKIDRNRWPVLVTYADDWQGHKGTIYLASGWVLHGKTKPERRYVINGRLVARKAGPKTRTHAEMVALGAICIGSYSATRFVHLED